MYTTPFLACAKKLCMRAETTYQSARWPGCRTGAMGRLRKGRLPSHAMSKWQPRAPRQWQPRGC